MKKLVCFFLFLGISFSSLAGEIKLLNSYKTDPNLFIQGLELNSLGKLVYSSGLYGESEIGYLSLQSAQREEIERLPPNYFAEGLTITPYGIWQLSWREQTAFLREPDNFNILKIAHYLGEGWGVAYDKEKDWLWLSNGSDKLQIFDPKHFRKRGEIQAHYQGQPVFRLNELEFANGFIYANIWQTTQIAKIEPQSGKVVKMYDFHSFVEKLGLQDPDDVLNGIAHISDNRFLITGKRFGVIWEVELKD